VTVRLAWDSRLPVEASSTFSTGGRTYRSGEAFPWRDLGLREDEAYTMWCSFLLHHPVGAVATPAPAAVELESAPAEKPAKRAARGRKN
jgi:hypothetical protein